MQVLIVAGSIGALLVLASSIVSLMAVFMGGRGPDLQALLAGQTAAAIGGLPVTLFLLADIVRQMGWHNGWRSIWQVIPGWMVRSLLGMLTLALVGELSLFLVARSTSVQLTDGAHVPLATALSSTFALSALYAYGKIKTASRR